MRSRPLACAALVLLALLVFGAALSVTLEPFASATAPLAPPDRCRYTQPTTRYALTKAGADRPCLWHSANEGYGPMDHEACQAKCASAEHPGCVGFTQPTDGVCVLYGTGALPDTPPTGTERGGEGAVTFHACRDTAPPTYLEQGDNQLDIACTRAADPKPRDTCQYLGSSAGCAEGRCLPPFAPDATMSCTQAWSALLDEFPASVDPAQGGLMDREAFLRASCDGSVGIGNRAGAGVGAGTAGTCAPRK